MDNLDSRILEHITVFLIVEITAIVFLGVMVIEAIVDYVTKRRPSLWESFSNASIAIVNSFLELTIVGTTFIIMLLFAEGFQFVQLPFAPWTWALCLVLADFTYYWMHRIEHEKRILWAVHSVHHSSPEFNMTTSLRLSWVESLYEAIFFVPMILLGFDLVQVLACLFIVVTYQNWVHTERIGKLGWLDKVFNTPSVHRVHHGSNPQYIDKNYGGILMLWDHMFGTYKAEEEKVKFGITTPIGSSNPFLINFKEFWEIGKDVRNAASMSDALSYIWKPPGWTPELQTIAPRANKIDETEASD